MWTKERGGEGRGGELVLPLLWPAFEFCFCFDIEINKSRDEEIKRSRDEEMKRWSDEERWRSKKTDIMIVIHGEGKIRGFDCEWHDWE